MHTLPRFFLAGLVTLVACAAAPESGDSGESVNEHDEDLSGCYGHASSSIPKSGDYFLTSFGAGSDSGTMSCGENTNHGSWYYAASRQRYGCGKHIKIEANGKCVIAATDDYGPDECVEAAAGGPIIDASPLVAEHLFGSSSAGWSDHFRIKVTEVSESTPLGPTSCGGSSNNGGGGNDNSNGTGSGSLGGNVSAAPAAGHNADGRLEVFAVDASGHMATSFQTSPNGGWSAWYGLGGDLQGVPAVIDNEDGRLEVFARGADDHIHHAWQDAPNGKIGSFESLGGDVVDDPTVARNADGRLEVFVVGTDDNIWHRWQTKANGGWNDNWEKLGDAGASGGLHHPRAVKAHDGKLWVFARGKDGAIYHAEEDSSGWSDWASLGGSGSGPAQAVTNEDGRLELFEIGADSALHHRWEEKPGGAWSGWSSLGGSSTSLFASNDADGSIVVFARGSKGPLYRIEQNKPNSGWSSWKSLGGDVRGAPSADRNKDGRLEVFFRDTKDEVDHRWEDAKNGW